MAEKYFYWGTTKKVASVFGAIFNGLQIARQTADGTLHNVTEVPLSYGPRAKFLSRIRENKEHKISIQLPRMSYIIEAIQYDETRTVAPTQRRKVQGDKVGHVGVPYELGFELSLYGRTLDDVLQLIEQIVPIFRPEYTIQIKEIEGPGTTTDVSFRLASVSLNDDYEGDWADVRAVTATLSFTSNIKYLGPLDDQTIIKRVEASVRNMNDGSFWEKVVEKIDEPTSFISNIDPNQVYKLTVADTSGFVAGENIVGSVSGHGALIDSVISGTEIHIRHVENTLILGEDVTGESSGTVQEIIDVEIYNAE